MNEWLYDELADLDKANQDRTTKDNRLRLLEQQTAVIWNDLTPVLRDAVQKLNEMSEFRKLTGGIAYVPGIDRIEISKQTTLPGLKVVVSRSAIAVSLEYEYFKSPRGHAKTTRQTLHVELGDNGRPSFKNDEGRALEVEEAVRQIMRPFLHPHLLE